MPQLHSFLWLGVVYPTGSALSICTVLCHSCIVLQQALRLQHPPSQLRRPRRLLSCSVWLLPCARSGDDSQRQHCRLVEEEIDAPTHDARTLQTRIEAVLRSPRVPCGCSTGSQHAPEMTGEGNVEVEWYLRHRPLFSRAVLPFQNRLLRLCNTYRYRSPPRSLTQEQSPSHAIHPVYSTPYDTKPLLSPSAPA